MIVFGPDEPIAIDRFRVVGPVGPGMEKREVPGEVVGSVIASCWLSAADVP